jgi:hypothetical protein
MSASEIDFSQYGKVKDIIISQHAMPQMEILITQSTLHLVMTSRVYGHTFTIHSAKHKLEQLVSLNMTRLLQAEYNMT